MTQTPALSVILATTGGFPAIRVTMRHLQRQSVAKELEIIILSREAANFSAPPEEAAAFHSFRVAPLERDAAVAVANAEGVRLASATLVVFAEDHAFPRPDWASTLIERHRENWAGVGPVVQNANPATAVSWADYLIGYGPWHEGQRAGPVEMLPGHNSSYKRAVLLRQGGELAKSLRAESVLHTNLRAEGETLYLENRAVIAHLNFARWRTFLPVQFQNGRQYGAARSLHWRATRRAVYALASPLIPLVRFLRLLRLNVRFPSSPSRTSIFLAVLGGLLADGLGQGIGYALGAGRSSEFLTDFEYNRIRFVTLADAHAVEKL